MATNVNNNAQFINPFPPGWPTSTHETVKWNQMITQVNNVTGNGTAVPLTGSTLALSGSLTGATSISGPAPATTTAATLAVTAAMAGTCQVLSLAAGVTATLPAASGTGNEYMFVIGTTATSAAYKILAASSSDNLIGFVTGENAGTAKCFPAARASGFHSLQMPFAGTQPSGGFEGDWFIFVDAGTNLWHVRGCYQAGTTPTTPFNTATS